MFLCQVVKKSLESLVQITKEFHGARFSTIEQVSRTLKLDNTTDET